MIVQDNDGYWHEMRPVANRAIALCGYLNLDSSALERQQYQSKPDGKPTCAGCREKLAKEIAK